MLKTGFYLLLLAAAATLAAVTAASIPRVFIQEQVDDLAADIVRANRLAQTEMQIVSFEQIAQAARASSDRRLIASLTPPPAVEGEPSGPVDADAVGEATKALLKQRQHDLLIVVGPDGAVIAAHGDRAPKSGTSIAGLPPVKDALRGFSRDWFWAQRGQVDVVGAAPIVSGGTIVGAVLTGTAIDGALVARVLGTVDPVAQPGRRLHIALSHNGNLLASSARDAATQAIVVHAVSGGGALPAASDVSQAQVQFTTIDKTTEIARLVSAIGDGNSKTDVGIVVVGQRAVTENDVVKLAVAAYNLDPEAGDEGTPVVLPLLTFIVLFLIGWLLMNSEHQRPARKIAIQLREVGKHIETGELDVRAFQGTYFDLAKELNSVLIGLRKRLERERAGIPMLTGESEAVPVPEYLKEATPPARQPTPAAVEATPVRRPVPVRVSHVAAPAAEEVPPPEPEVVQLLDVGLEAVSDDEFGEDPELPPEPDLEERDHASEELALIAAEAAASLPSADDLPAIQDSTLDIPGEQLIQLIARERASGSMAAKVAAVKAEKAESAVMEDAHQEPTRVLDDADIDDLGQPLDLEGTATGDATRLNSGVPDQSTVVDDVGLMQALASTEMSDSDPLQESAIAKAQAAIMGASTADEPSEIDTAEVSRNDEAFIQALAASATPSAEAALNDALSPESLLEKLKERGAVPKPPPGEALRADTAVRKLSPQLLRRAASDGPNPFVHQAPTTPGTAPKRPEVSDAPNPDQEYFEKLFEQFVKTKEECGEDTEGLTLARFVRRLDQNKKTLMSRYGCRSVRFQVYVKKGKAALKATPIK
jgi:hypothetical protein